MSKLKRFNKTKRQRRTKVEPLITVSSVNRFNSLTNRYFRSIIREY